LHRLGPFFIATLLALFSASGVHAQEYSDTATMLLTLNAWFIVMLIAVPWLVIISAPILFVLMVPASAVLGPAYVALRTTLAAERKRRERAAPERRKLNVFVPEVPGLRNVREKLEALLASHQERIPARTGVCACLLERGRRVFLTVRFFQDRRYWSHQVKGFSANDALQRMDWKLTRWRGKQERRVPGDSQACFASKPWCRNASHCPFQAWQLGAATSPA
jgi:hypothetical protein